MGSDWKNIPLGNLITLQRGHDLPSQDREDGDVPIMGSSGLTGYHSQAKCEGPGVVVGRSGNSMGVVSFCEVDYWPLNTALYITDFKGNDPRYIYYLLSLIDFDKFNSGSAQKSLNRNAVYPYEVWATDNKDEQKSIGQLLEEYEKKIALNRQINTTLESMAQALFKSWFVDFDPVIDNALAAGNEIPDALQKRAARREALRQQTNKTANKTTGTKGASGSEQALPNGRLPSEIQQLFPDAFVFTDEMGWVPEGWEVGVLEDLLVLQRGFDLPKSSRTDGIYPLMAASGQDGTHNESKVPGPGITTGRSGKLGEVCFVERDFWPLNTTLWVKEFRRSSPYHAFYLLKSMDLEKYNSGSAVPTLNRNYIHNVSALLPSKNVIAAYDKFVSGCYSKKYDNDEQIKSLANLRDSLLPKLLSGQITIPDAEQQLAEVL